MKIIRNGQEYELTTSELIEAHNEYELSCMKADVRSLLIQYPDLKFVPRNKQLTEIAENAIHNLTKDDGYYDSYWGSVSCTIDNWLKNKNYR